MDTMIKENGITFKDLEKNLYESIMKQGRDSMRNFLFKYDDFLRLSRDTKKYRHKGLRKTTIKTLFGDIEYSRVKYQVQLDDGKKKYVYLLDEALKLNNIGLVSSGLAEQIAKSITENSYRECARSISELTGVKISPMGVWNIVQELGQRACDKEQELVDSYRKGEIIGEKEAPVLFEEADGVYLTVQGKERKHYKKGKAEMKVAIAYDGWKKEGSQRYAIDGMVVTAGFAGADEFRKCHEATVASKYNTDMTEVRVLNADGGSWTKNVSGEADYFQLDVFHRNKAIREKIHQKEAVKEVFKRLKNKDIEGMFDYLEAYKNSLSDDDEIAEADKLISYLRNNKEGLIPYRERGIELPKNKDGLEYRGMGTMENHIWSVIARRMKHNHTAWSIRGGNNLAKLLALKNSGKLSEITAEYNKKPFKSNVVAEIVGQVLSSGSTAKFTGKGYEYGCRGHLPVLDYKSQGNRHELFGLVDV